MAWGVCDYRSGRAEPIFGYEPPELLLDWPRYDLCGFDYGGAGQGRGQDVLGDLGQRHRVRALQDLPVGGNEQRAPVFKGLRVAAFHAEAVASWALFAPAEEVVSGGRNCVKGRADPGWQAAKVDRDHQGCDPVAVERDPSGLEGLRVS